MFFKLFTYFFSIILIIILFFCIPVYLLKTDSIKQLSDTNSQPITQELNNFFYWPAPGYTRITSNFGYRKAPANGASTFHSGIDIGAPAGSNIIAAFSGEVKLTEFKGAGGYTITIANNDFSSSYCHVDPNFIVKVGDFVTKRSNNWKSSVLKTFMMFLIILIKIKMVTPQTELPRGPHLHFTLRLNGNIVNPLDYL